MTRPVAVSRCRFVEHALVACSPSKQPSHRCRCVRADFAYRKAGRKAPDRPPVLLQSGARRTRLHCWLAADERLVLGGRSMGGRICSLAVGDEDDPLPARVSC